MRGRIAVWNDDRGFGFINPDAGGDRLFFHVSGMARGASRPSVGDSVTYEMSTASNGKARAVNVRPAGLGAVSGVLMSKRVILSAAALLPFPVLWGLVEAEKLPAHVLWFLAGMSASSSPFATSARSIWSGVLLGLSCGLLIAELWVHFFPLG